MIKIKLKKPDDSAAKAALDEIFATYPVMPMLPNAVWLDQFSGYAESSVFDGNLYLDAVYVNAGERGKGNATGILKTILIIADAHGAKVVLTPVPFGSDGTKLDADALVAWYSRYGFEPDKDHLDYLIRLPK